MVVSLSETTIVFLFGWDRKTPFRLLCTTNFQSNWTKVRSAPFWSTRLPIWIVGGSVGIHPKKQTRNKMSIVSSRKDPEVETSGVTPAYYVYKLYARPRRRCRNNALQKRCIFVFFSCKILGDISNCWYFLRWVVGNCFLILCTFSVKVGKTGNWKKVVKWKVIFSNAQSKTGGNGFNLS